MLNQALKSGTLVFATKLLGYPLGLLLVVILARALPQEQMGGYFMCMSLVMLTMPLVQMGTGHGLMRLTVNQLMANNPAGVRRGLLIAAVIVGLTGFTAVWAYAGPLGDWIGSASEGGEVVRHVLVWVGLVAAAYAIIGTCSETLRGLSDPLSAALLTEQFLTRTLFVGVLALALWWQEGIDLERVLQMLLLAAALAALYGIFRLSVKLRTIGTHGDGASVKQVVSSMPSFLLFRINGWVTNSAAVWFVGWYQSAEGAALFGAASTLALLILAPWAVVNAAMGPTVVGLHASHRAQELRDFLRAVAGLALIPAVAAFVIYAAAGEWLLATIFKPDYAEAYLALLVLGAGRVCAIALGTPQLVLSLTQNDRIVLRLYAATMPLLLLAYVVCANRFGILGVAAVAGFAPVVQSAAFAAMVWKTEKMVTVPSLSPALWLRLIDAVKAENKAVAGGS